MILQPRDLILLWEIAVMRVADREQARRAAGFRSTTRINARLLTLTSAKLLRRFFLGTVGGARKALYSVSEKGANLVQLPDRGPRRGRDQVLIADFFVMHQLAVNEIYCRVKHEAIPIEGVKFLRWESFAESLTGSSLIPDGYIELDAPGRTVAMFLEVDMGTETRKVWQEKVHQYVSCAMSGRFTSDFRQSQFRVLVVANSEGRVASLRTATRAVTEKVFWFTTLDRILCDGFWSAIWKRPSDETDQALV